MIPIHAFLEASSREHVSPCQWASKMSGLGRCAAEGAGQTGAFGCGLLADPLNDLLECMVRDVHARIAQRQEDRLALARLPKSLSHQGVE